MRFVVLFLLLTFCQPLLKPKNYAVEWEIKAPHTLFHHQFMQSFDSYKHLITADSPTKIILTMKEPQSAPLIYSPAKEVHSSVNVERWHTNYAIEYVIESPGLETKKGVLKAQLSFQDHDDYGNILTSGRINEKVMHQMIHEMIIILNT